MKGYRDCHRGVHSALHVEIVHKILVNAAGPILTDDLHSALGWNLYNSQSLPGQHEETRRKANKQKQKKGGLKHSRVVKLDLNTRRRRQATPSLLKTAP